MLSRAKRRLAQTLCAVGVRRRRLALSRVGVAAVAFGLSDLERWSKQGGSCPKANH